MDSQKRKKYKNSRSLGKQNHVQSCEVKPLKKYCGIVWWNWWLMAPNLQHEEVRHSSYMTITIENALYGNFGERNEKKRLFWYDVEMETKRSQGKQNKCRLKDLPQVEKLDWFRLLKSRIKLCRLANTDHRSSKWMAAQSRLNQNMPQRLS